MRRSQRPAYPGHRPAGFGLLEVMLVLALLTTAIIGAYLYMHYTATARLARQQEALLQQADRQIQAFAFDHYRLPCPDTNDDGVEDCSASATVGRLPYKTLGLDGAQISTGVNQLRYQVARTGNDLTTATNAFEPSDLDGNQYDLEHTNGTDFCTTVAAAATAGVTRAYAIAAPGATDADGDGSPFDGDNAGTSTLDSPTRAGSATYDDHVRSVSPTELATQSGCDMVNSSLNAVSLIYGVVGDVNDQNSDTLESAQDNLEQTEFSMIMLAVSIYLDIAQETAADVAEVAASAALAANTTACALLVIPSCALAVADAAAVAAAAAAISESIAAAVLHATAYVPFLLSVDELNTVINEAGGASDATVDMTTAIAAAQENLAAAQTAETNAASAVATAQANDDTAASNLQDAEDKLDAALATYTSADSSIAALLETAKSAARDYAQAQYASSEADSEVTKAKQQVTTVEDEIQSVQDKIDAETSDTTDATKASYASQMTQYQSDLADAQAALADAETAAATADANETTAATAYQDAVNALLTALADNKTCQDNSCTSGLQDLFDNYSNYYLVKLQMDDALTDAQSTYSTAQTNASNAQDSYDKLVSASQTTTSSSKSNLWSDTDAEAVLNAADAKGTVQ